MNKKVPCDYELVNYFSYQLIAGFDEAGRGALAGPIVVAAVILPQHFQSVLIRDSKQLSKNQRNQAYQIIIKNALAFAIVEIDVATIANINPKQSSILGMEQAFKKLAIKPEVCLIDFEKPHFENFNGIMESLIKGDSKAINIAAASILAKVTRDQIMINYHQQFPQYGFNLHKGYGTQKHLSCLVKYGVLSIHRQEYQPIKKLLRSTK